MVVRSETKSCRACAKGKRKCGRELPRCDRCTRRGTDCTYPPSKPSSFVLLQDDHSPLASQTSGWSTDFQTVDSFQSVELCSGLAENYISSFKLSCPLQPVLPADTGLLSIWFNLPYTWQIVPWPQVAFRTFKVSIAKNLVDQIGQWYAQWISTGSNPFIHAELYSDGYPRCLQDAYTALSLYMQRTPDNEHVVFQILESRLKQLLIDNCVSLVHTDKCSSNQSLNADVMDLTTLDHLARVQTLASYLLLMLYNGDIRLRNIAEQYMSTLEDWNQRMVEASRLNLASNSSFDPLDGDALWHAWILAESLRRTFMTARTLLAMYEMIKAGKALPAACKGCMAFTIRKGAWDAKSAAEWVDMATEVDLGLIQARDAKRLVRSGEMSTNDVDSFARAFIEGTCD